MVILLADAFAPDLPARLKPFGEVTADVARVAEAEACKPLAIEVGTHRDAFAHRFAIGSAAHERAS